MCVSVYWVNTIDHASCHFYIIFILFSLRFFIYFEAFFGYTVKIYRMLLLLFVSYAVNSSHTLYLRFSFSFKPITNCFFSLNWNFLFFFLLFSFAFIVHVYVCVYVHSTLNIYRNALSRARFETIFCLLFFFIFYTYFFCFIFHLQSTLHMLTG